MNIKTHEQNVVDEKLQLAHLKNDYMEALERYISIPKINTFEKDSAAIECQRIGNKYFNHAEEFVGNSDLLGAHTSALWAQGFAEDCAEILLSLVQHFKFLENAFNASSRLQHINYRPGSTAFANMQRMVVRYLTEEKASEIKKKFLKSNLPTYGFDNKAKNYMDRDKILSFLFGISFIIIMLLIALAKPEPTKFQYMVFRTVLALSAGGIGAVIPGTISVKISKFVRAGGAIALFVAVYFLNPAKFFD